MLLYGYTPLIAVIILYINTVDVIKKASKDKNTAINTVIGCICSFIILLSIFEICGK